MTRVNLPKPDHPLPPGPDRPWGTGSIDQRGNGYTARWREGGKQVAQQFATIAEAEQQLAQVYPRTVPEPALRKLIEKWRGEASGDWKDGLLDCAADLEVVVRAWVTPTSP